MIRFAASADEYEMTQCFGGAGSALWLSVPTAKTDTAVDVAVSGGNVREDYTQRGFAQHRRPL